MRMNFFKKMLFLPRLPFLWTIRLYQKTLSLDHGPMKHLYPYGYCKFTPSCSQYGYDVIKKRGLVVGIPKTLWRIFRCNPWTEGGIDEAK